MELFKFKMINIRSFLNNTLKPKLVQSTPRLKLHKTLGLSTLLYGGEIWTRHVSERLPTSERRLV
jgi:hypothetical protein